MYSSLRSKRSYVHHNNHGLVLKSVFFLDVYKRQEKSIRNEDLLALMKLEKSMVFFNTSIRGNEVMLAKLQNIFQEPQYIDKDLVEDVEIELKPVSYTHLCSKKTGLSLADILIIYIKKEN